MALVFGLTIAWGLDYGVRQIDLKFWKTLFWTRIPCGKQVRIFITGSKTVFTPSFCAMNSKVMRMLILPLGCEDDDRAGEHFYSNLLPQADIG